MSSGSIEDPKTPPPQGEQQTGTKAQEEQPKNQQRSPEQQQKSASQPIINSSPVIPTPEKPAKQPKMISLQADELIKWDKRLKELTGQVKSLTAENTALKNELSNQNKRSDERRMLDREGMQETINELQKILAETTTNQSRLQKERDRLKDELAIERANKQSREKEIQTLRDTSSEYFLLKQEVNRLESQISQLRKSKETVKKIEDANNQLQEKVVELEEQLKETRDSTTKLQSRSVSLKLEKDRAIEEAEGYREKYEYQKSQRDQLQEKCDMLQMEVKDFEKERELAAKRFSSEMKQLRETVAKELKYRNKLQEEVDDLKKQLQERSDKYAGKSERFLAQKLQEMEVENTALKQSTEMVSNRISELLVKLKEKDQSILTLTKELTKTWPNLEDSEGQEYVERQIIDMGKKQKFNYEEIIEKVMIENLRLKHSIQTIGSEYNEELRRKKE